MRIIWKILGFRQTLIPLQGIFAPHQKDMNADYKIFVSEFIQSRGRVRLTEISRIMQTCFKSTTLPDEFNMCLKIVLDLLKRTRYLPGSSALYDSGLESVIQMGSFRT